MSDPIIRVENISKKFIISHEAVARHNTLRDAITAGTRNAFRKIKKDEEKFARIEEFWALKDVNFDIYPGDRVGIIGRNGAGKSTLLKILSRITEPTEGKISIKGRVASLLEVGTGFHPELTGRENIYLNGAILGMSRAEIKAKFDEIVAFAEVERFLDTPVKRFSSGMYVRLAFAVAAHLEPEILIVDEVLAVGDAQFQKKCLGKMEEVSKNEGRTVLFVSHNMGVVSQLCQKAIMMKNGKILTQGNTADVIQSYITSDRKDGSVYEVDENLVKNKPNYFKKIYSSNAQNVQKTDFSFDENILLRFSFQINEKAANLQVGIGLNDKLQNRIFTLLREIEYFRKNSEGFYEAEVLLPANLIAPNIYSFVFAIWTKNGNVFDLVENVCMIKIHDNGTDLAHYEGSDHGFIITEGKWSFDLINQV
jgi:lipopolysaccharide transport system ATP-binding protein